MLVERYEIREKLGQGGLGTVHSAYDRVLKRKVAIKRIIVEGDEDADELARKVQQETDALASLQHPHIVTIYDVSQDDDGPFVVMELIKGETIDDIVEKAPLTERDFRAFAEQVQEALIAAQDLDMVHRDLKPSNVMVNWLPSGKFQIKIVDFGLAKFSHLPSKQTVDQDDSVMGSIFFMAPEQFERAPLDARTDMYSIGCVYYFALSGQNPYQGETGPQVMAAHLQHRVVPLAELRPDIPSWIADWVMWHINCAPEHRPANAREALKNFIELETTGTTTTAMTTGEPDPATEAPRRPRLVIPGATPAAEPPANVPAPQPAAPVSEPQPVAEPEPVKVTTAPQPLQPPSDAPPSVHTTSQQQADASMAQAAPDAPPAAPAVQPVLTAQQAAPAPAQGGLNPGGAQAASQLGGLRPQQARQKSSKGAKIAIIFTLTVVAVILGAMLMQISKKNSKTEIYNALVAEAAKPQTTKLSVNSEELQILLNATRAGNNRSRETAYKALAIAEAKDNTDVNARIAEFATTEMLPDEIRVALLSRVLNRRADPSTVPYLLKYIRKSENEKTTAAALKAIVNVGGEDELDDFLDLIQFTSSSSIRRAAEEATAAVLKKSSSNNRHASALITAVENATNDDNRRTMIRLLGQTGSDNAEAFLNKTLESGEKYDKLAAIEALKNWPKASTFETLVGFLSTQTDSQIRPKAFKACSQFLLNNADKLKEADAESYWKMLAANAKTDSEQDIVISGLVRSQTGEWAIKIVEKIGSQSDSDYIIDRSKKAVRRIKEQRKIKGKD